MRLAARSGANYIERMNDLAPIRQLYDEAFERYGDLGQYQARAASRGGILPTPS